MTNLDVNKDSVDVDSSAIDVENDVKDLVYNVEKLDFKTDFELTDEELHELTSVWEKWDYYCVIITLCPVYQNEILR